MNATETIARDWLVGQGHTPRYQPHKSPDFLLEDGTGIEIKLAREHVVTFYDSQMEALASCPECRVLIFNGKSREPVADVAFKDIPFNSAERLVGYLFRSVNTEGTGQVLYIRNLSDEDAARIRRAAQVRGLSLAQYIAALSRLHRSMLDTVNAPAFEGCLSAFGLNRVQE